MALITHSRKGGTAAERATPFGAADRDLGGYFAWFQILSPTTRCLMPILVHLVSLYPDAYYFVRNVLDKSNQSAVFEQVAFL